MKVAGIHAMHEIVNQLRAEGVRLVLANPSHKVQAQLKRTKILEDIGQEWIYVRTADAVQMCALHLRERMHAVMDSIAVVPNEAADGQGAEAGQGAAAGKGAFGIEDW